MIYITEFINKYELKYEKNNYCGFGFIVSV